LNGRIELKEIVAALNFLKRKGLIQKRADGHFEVKDDIVITSDEVKSLAIRTFHRRVLEQAMVVKPVAVLGTALQKRAGGWTP
jgi:hypothetical protein